MNAIELMGEQLNKEQPPIPDPAPQGAETLTIEQINTLISNGLKSAQSDIKKMCEEMISAAVTKVSEPVPDPPEPAAANTEGE